MTLDQNSEQALRLLGAQRSLYSGAKSVRFVRLIGSVVLAGVAPVIVLFDPSPRIWFTVVGAIWAVLAAAILKPKERNLIGDAARAQEEFDTEVLGIPWNDSLVGSKLAHEVVFQAAAKVDIEASTLKNWYVSRDDIDIVGYALLCQRANIVWDKDNRRTYAWTVCILTVSIVVLQLVLALVKDMSVKDWLLMLVIPSLSAIIYGFEVTRSHFEMSMSRKDDARRVEAAIESHISNRVTTSSELVRTIQDSIYRGRTSDALIPDRWHMWTRKKDEAAMAFAADQLRERMKRKST